MQTDPLFRRPVGNGFDNAPEDILAAKGAFARIRRLTEPREGFHGFMDGDFEQTIRKFQRDRQLLDDGMMRPGGETERNMRRDMGLLPKEPPFALTELDLKRPVGNGGENRTDDLRGVSKALGRLGLFAFDKTDEPPALISGDLDAGIRKFQQKIGARDNGIVEPGDETARALRTAVAQKMSSEEPAAQPEESITSGALRRAADKTAEGFENQPGGGRPDKDDAAEATENERILQETDWRQAVPDMTGGEVILKVKGPVKIDLDTPALGLDGIDYEVDWLPLKPNGEVGQEFRSSNHRSASGRGYVPGIIGAFKRKPDLFRPPYDHPYGFQVKIRIPPQQQPHGNSPGPSLRIQFPRGGLIGKK